MDEIESEAPPTSTEESSSDSDELPGLEYGGWSSEEDGGDEEPLLSTFVLPK